MRAIWIDEGKTPDWPKLEREQITDLYFSARYGTKAEVDDARARGYRVGIYRARSWDEGLAGKEWAKLLSDDVARFVGGDGRGIGVQLGVQMNIEHKDEAWIKSCLLWWRLYRPLRETSWACEGFQGGWMTNIRTAFTVARVLLVPENYGGDMDKPTEQWDSDGTVQDLIDYGFPAKNVVPFHDAKYLRRGWRGFAFTQQRLP